MTASPLQRPDGPRRDRMSQPTDDPPSHVPLSEGDTSRIAPAIRALAVPIGSVRLHPNNPRVGNTEAVAASLRRFGQQKPVVVQRSTGLAMAGNHIVRAALTLEWNEIAANVVEIDDAAATAYMLADNRTSDLGGYDERLLAAILAEQAAADNLGGTGYDTDDIAAIVAAAGLAEPRDLDACPDVPPAAAVYVRPGDLYELGTHRLLVGDATRADDVARLLAGAPVDLLVADPPYGIAYSGRTRRALTIENDDLGEDGTRQLVAGALRMAPLRPGGAVYVFAPGGSQHLPFLLALRDAGLEVHQSLVWLKDRFVLGRGDYHARHETILYGWKPGAAHHFAGGRAQDTVWECPRPARNAEHPTQKPVALVERAVRNSSRPGEAVYDPFVGSGTTLVVAEVAGRRGFAMEIDPEYAQVALGRWAALTGRQPSLVERVDGRDG